MINSFADLFVRNDYFLTVHLIGQNRANYKIINQTFSDAGFNLLHTIGRNLILHLSKTLLNVRIQLSLGQFASIHISDEICRDCW